MSASGTYHTQFDPEATVAIVPTGIADDPRCISDLDQFADRVLDGVVEIDNALRVKNNHVKQIIVAGPESLATVIDKNTKDYIHVSSNHCCAKRFLDDGAEPGDGYHIPSVIEDGPEAGRLFSLREGTREETIENFDLNDAADRARLTPDLLQHLSPDRYERATKKAQSKRLEQITNDWFDEIPTANHVVAVDDGRGSHDHIVDHANNECEWIKYPTPCPGEFETVSLDGSASGSLSYVQAALLDPRFDRDVPVHRLSAEQRDRLAQWLTEREREQLGLERLTSQPSHTSQKTVSTATTASPETTSTQTAPATGD